MGFKSQIALYKAFLVAGFSLAKLRSVEAQDGLCWEVTLKKGKVEILHISNGGFGGPDEVRSLLQNDDEIGRYVDELYAVPEVAQIIRDAMIDVLKAEKKYAKDGETRDFDAEIEAAKDAPLKRADDTTAMVIGIMTDAKQTIDQLKRAAKRKICWLEKCEAGDSNTYVYISAPLNAETRAHVHQKYGETLDVILNDLIEGL